MLARQSPRHHLPAMELREYLKLLPFERFRNPPPVVPVLRFEGVIAPSHWRGSLSLQAYAGTIERAFNHSGAVAVALIVNSPGGSPVQSSLLYRRVRQLAEEKRLPVFAFAEDVAASGGYWLALAGDEIFAEETSLLGSIGVVSASFGFPRLLERLGVERRLYTAGENKALLDPFLPENPSDVERLTALQQDIHASFRDHVRRRRVAKIDLADESLFSGEVMTGRMALDRGLIDGIGDLRSVMRARFGDNVRLVPVTTERRRRWLPWPRRRPWIGDEAAGTIEGLAGWLEARLLWARFGL